MAVSLEAYQQALDEPIARAVAELSARNDGFSRRLDAADLGATDLTDGAALARLPVMTKDDLRERQLADPPFGGMLSRDEHPRRIFQSPGPVYEPEPDEPDPWRFAEALAAATFTAEDRVLNAFGYHLSPAGAMFEQACLALGATVLPIGVGSRDLQVQAAVDVGATAYIGPPSYLKALLESAEEQGRGDRLRLAKAFVTAEPLPPGLRTWLTERVPVVRQGYGTAEAGSIAYECEREEGMHVASGALVQICELDEGRPIEEPGRPGQVVVTVPRTDYPVVRFGTGDLSAWMEEACDCGVGTPRIRGWLGRVGQAVKVKGMFLHPQQVDELMRQLPVAAYRVEIDRVDHKDTLRCTVVAGDGAPDDLAARVEAAFKDGLRFTCDVRVADALPDDAERFVDARTWEE